MELKITQEYYLKVVPEWYDNQVLSGEGSLEEQVCEYERRRAETDVMYVIDLKRGKTIAEIVKTDSINVTCIYCFSKTCDGNCPESQREENGT